MVFFIIMKLSWRVLSAFMVLTCMYFVFYYCFKQMKYWRGRDKSMDNTNVVLKSARTNQITKKRVEKFMVQENISGIFPAVKSLKFNKPLPNTNYRLSRMLYQLWDPFSYQNQGSMLNCENLVSMDEKKYRQGRRFARKLNRKFYEYLNVSDILEAIRDSCLPLKNIFRYQTPKFGPSSYSIAYTITLDRTAEQSLRMLASIYHHDNVYCIQPNARFGFQYIAVFKRLAECIPNIFVPERIYSIRIKTINHVKAELNCFEKLLNVSVPWKYGINLPSSAFPLRNNSHLIQYLRRKPYESVITWAIPNERFMKRVRYSHILKETEGETLLLRTAVLKTKPPEDLVIFRKGVYFISTRQFYEFLTTSSIAKKLLNWVEDAKSPEDFFYASLYRYRNAPGGLPYDPDVTDPNEKDINENSESIIDMPQNDLLLSLWKSDGAQRCHGQYRGHVCTFGAADLRWVLEHDQLFAYSFDFRIDRVAVDCLTKHLHEPILGDTISDDNDWPSVTSLVKIY